MSTVIVLVVATMVSLGASVVLVTRLTRLGERLGFSEAMLGLVTALAADSPEISAAISALVRGQHDVAIGVVIGSNAFNLAALVGLSAVVAGRVVLHRRVIMLEGLVGISIAVIAVCLVAGWLRPGGAASLAGLAFLPYVAVCAVHPAGRRRLLKRLPWRDWLAGAMVEEELELSTAISPPRGGLIDLCLAVVAVALVVGASATMQGAAVTIAERLSIPGIVTGGIVLAALTSLPNAVAAVYLAHNGRGAAMLSEAMNSNTLNILVGLLVPAIVVGLDAPSVGTQLMTVWYLSLTVLTLGLAYGSRGLTRLTGSLIIGVYVAAVLTVVLTA